MFFVIDLQSYITVPSFYVPLFSIYCFDFPADAVLLTEGLQILVASDQHDFTELSILTAGSGRTLDTTEMS